MRALRRVRPGRPALPARPVRRRGAVRARGPAAPTATLRQLRRGAAARARTLRLSAYRTGGGRRGNVATRPGPGAQDQRPVRRPGGEPARRPSAARRPRRSTTPSCAGRWCCAPAAGRSPPRTSRSSPATSPRRSPGCTASPRAGRAAPGSGCWWCRTWPSDDVGRIRCDDLRARRAEALERISDHLDERRLVGTRLVVEPPDYRADRGGQRDARGPVRPGRGRPQATCCAALYRLYRPAARRPGRQRLAVRPGGAGARGACGAGPRSRAWTWPRRCSVAAVPGRRGDRPARRGDRSGSTCRRPRWSTPTSTRSGCGDEGAGRRAWPARTRSARRCRRCSATTRSPSSLCAAWTRCSPR